MMLACDAAHRGVARRADRFPRTPPEWRHGSLFMPGDNTVMHPARAWLGPLILLTIAVAAVSCSRDSEVAKREYLASGDQLMSQGKTREAIVQYRNAVRQDPRFGEARYRLAEAYVENAQLSAAAREYIRAADLLPNNAQAQVKAGRLQLAVPGSGGRRVAGRGPPRRLAHGSSATGAISVSQGGCGLRPWSRPVVRPLS
jgi:hypothetical protein